MIAAPPADSAELLDNGDFDNDISGWNFVPLGGASTLTHDTMDVDGSPSSGSARVEVDPGDVGNGARPFQCVPVVSGATYDIEAWVFVPASTVAESNFIRVQWWPELDCDGTNLGTTDVSVSVVPDTWLQPRQDDAPAPAGAHSAGFSLVVFEDSTLATNRVVFWDAARFVPEASGAAAFAGALLALATLRRAPH